MDLAEVHAELVEEIRDGLTYLAAPARMAELGDIFDALAVQLEGLALCHLFDQADLLQYRENLARVGHARRFFLRRSKSEKNDDDRHLALSRTRAVLDALVAGILPLARDIATLSTDTWNRAWEYEDDFCFYQLVHLIVKEPETFPTPAAREVLARFECALEGGESLHFQGAKALVARDPEAFGEALRSLLAAEQAQIDKARKSEAVLERDILFWPRSRVSIEGLALLKLAELLKLNVEGDLPLCPAMARLPWNDQPIRDFFKAIEQIGP